MSPLYRPSSRHPDLGRHRVALLVRRVQAGLGRVPVPRDAALHRRHRSRRADPAAPAERSVSVLSHRRRRRRRGSCALGAGRAADASGSRDSTARVVVLRLVSSVWPLFWMFARGQPPEQHRHLRHRRAVAPGGALRDVPVGRCARRTKCAVASGSCSSARACWPSLAIARFARHLQARRHLDAGDPSDNAHGRGGATLNSVDRGRRLPRVQLRGRERVDLRRRRASPSIARHGRDHLPRHPRHRPVLGVDRR